MSSLIEKLLAAGYPRKEMYHHYSDLYELVVTELDVYFVDLVVIQKKSQIDFKD